MIKKEPVVNKTAISLRAKIEQLDWVIATLEDEKSELEYQLQEEE